MTVALYDLSRAPITFDIMCFVVAAGAQTRRPRFVILADKPRGTTERDKSLAEWEWTWRVHRVIAASCRLLPAARSVEVVTDPEDCDRWRNAGDVLKPVPLARTCVGIVAAGGELPKLEAPLDGLAAVDEAGLSGAVVLQMRQAAGQTHKNCNRNAWIAAARRIAGMGLKVVVVPDTDEVLRGVRYPEDIPTFSLASIDLPVRAALYQRSLAVISSGVGPAYFNVFGRSRYAAFVRHSSTPLEHLTRPFERVWGVKWGGQVPWATDGQMIVYEHDTEDAIVQALERIAR